jgi:SAM-dependent methyltransferase
MRRERCGSCGYDGLELFLDLGMSPVADAYTATADELSETYPLQLAVCTGCQLVQLLDVVDHQILFGTGYSFYSSASPPLSAYHTTYAEQVLTRHGELAKRLTVEVGCNDGDLLRHFAAAGCPTLGVDPAGGPVVAARDRGLNVMNLPFGKTVAERLRADHGPAGIIIANHVLAHVESVADVLDGVQHLLADDGLAYVEVQYLPDLLVNNAFDLVYHEHRNFFSLTSLESAAQRWGLHIADAELTDRQGGSLRVVLARSASPSERVERIRASEGWLRGMGAYRGFQGRADRIRTRLLDAVDEATYNGLLVGYGAPAKATTLLNFCGLTSEHIDYAVDSTPAKQGRFIPGTGILIKPPTPKVLDPANTVLVLAWNYAPQIMRNNLAFTVRDGRWLIPIPSPVLL